MVFLNGRKHAAYIQLTALTSVVSLVIVSTSLGTEQWIGAIAYPKISGPSTSNINYGLFGGTLVRRPLSSAYKFNLHITCIWGVNACAWSCASTKDARETEVQDLVDGRTPNFTCYVVERLKRSADVDSPTTIATNNERIFTNAGLWISTIIFLVILIISLVGSIVLSILNCIKSPIETLFNIQGIYLTNAIALGSNFFVLLLYGICYDVYIKDDVAIVDTLVGLYKSHAWLGYSYWILHASVVLHIVGICLIIARQRIVNSDRAETRIDISTDTPATGVLF